MCEEAGESLQAALDLTRKSVERTNNKDIGDLLKLMTEVEQTTAMCIMLLVNIEQAITERRAKW